MAILGICVTAFCGGGLWWYKKIYIRHRRDPQRYHSKHSDSEDNDDITLGFPVDDNHIISIPKPNMDGHDMSYVELVDVKESKMCNLEKNMQIYEGFQLV
jgi:hypothetical protein